MRLGGNRRHVHVPCSGSADADAAGHGADGGARVETGVRGGQLEFGAVGAANQERDAHLAPFREAPAAA
jgi:hypothetical protein